MASILSLLKAFGKQPGCERYTADGERVKLLSTYLWLRQLTDGLTFERFLERFAPLADFDESNRKHPDDAIAFHCPRRKATADELKKPQWTAAEVVDFSALYVDMIREATVAGGMFSNSSVRRPQPSAKRPSAARSSQAAVTWRSETSAAQADGDGSKVRTL